MNIGPLDKNECLLTRASMLHSTIWSPALKKDKVCLERENLGLKGYLAQKAKSYLG